MPEVWPERAIARVNTVETMSPAAEAVSQMRADCSSLKGMRPGDVIYAFSDVTAGASGGLQAIGQLVQRSEGVCWILIKTALARSSSGHSDTTCPSRRREDTTTPHAANRLGWKRIVGLSYPSCMIHYGTASKDWNRNHR